MAFALKLIILLVFIILSKNEIIDNPVEITDKSTVRDYIININSDSLKTKRETLKVTKDIKKIEYNEDDYLLSQNTFLCKDESNNYFLFSEYYYYSANLYDGNKIRSLTLKKTLPTDIKYFGYIQESEFERTIVVPNAVGNIKKNEIVIYGKKNNYLYFNYIEESDYTVNINNIGDIISCNLIRSSRYICAYFQNNIIKISMIILVNVNSKQKRLKLDDTIEPDGFTDYENFILYDTDDENYKIFCATKTGISQAKCTAIYVKCIHLVLTNTFTKELKTVSLTNVNQDIVSSKHECEMIGFHSEFLLCCGDENNISCERKDQNFNSIGDFTLLLKGTISSLIINENTDHAIISYINDTSSNDYLFQYYIYLPKCKNILKNVNSFQNFKLNLSDLFERRTNTIYNIKFENLPSEYGTIKIGEEIVAQSIDYKIETDPEEAKLFFLSDFNEVSNSIKINFIISIEETYSSSKCYINLNFVNDNQTNNPNEIIEIEETTLKKDDTKINIEKDCYFTCEDCNENAEIDDIGNVINQNCIQCIEEYYFKIGTNDCYYDEIKKDGYYLDTKGSPHIWKKCYEDCQTCDEFGNSTYMNCLSCNDSLNLTSQGNCVKFFSTTDTFKFDFNDTSTYLNLYPDSTEINTEINKEQNKSELKTFEQASLSEFRNQIRNNITQYMNSSLLINGSNFIAVILSSDEMDPKDQLKLGISAIDLGNCTQVLKSHYNISHEESLIILNIETKENQTKNKNNDDSSFNLGKKNQVEIYDFSGRKLDLSVCKDDIKVMKYIGDVEELDFKSAKSLSTQGIDVFNASDNFFNDLCHKYDNTYGKDIIIDDRRNDIYQNATFCQNGCTYSGVDYDLMAAHCLCNSKIIQEVTQNITGEIKDKSENLNFKTLTKSFVSNLKFFNFNVIYCYNLVFDIQRLLKNIGFYIMFAMFIAQIIFLTIYLTKKLKPIKIYMLVFNNNKNENEVASPPRHVQFNEIKKSHKKHKEKKKKDLDKMSCMNNLKKSKRNNESKDDISKNKLKLFNDGSSLEDEFHVKFKEEPEIGPIPKNENVLKNLENTQSLSKSKTLSTKKRIKKMKHHKDLISENFSSLTNNQNLILNFNNSAKDVPYLKKRNILFSEIEKGNHSSIKKMKEASDKKSANEKIYNIKPKKKRRLIKKRILKNRGNINKMETIAESEIINYSNLSNTDEEIQDMDFEEALIKDKRPYLKIYWSFLVDSQIILGTFCTENYLNLFVIKLSFFLCTFEISFFLNALFYNDDYISDAYHNEGVLDFVSGLPKSIYSFVATLITTNLLKMLSNSKSELMKIIREKSKNKDYLVLIDDKLRKLRNKLIVYFILVFSLGLIFTYYVSAFCAVYIYSQKYWFYGCLESFAMDSIVALIICIFLALMRFIALKNRIKYFYTIANIISIFL